MSFTLVHLKTQVQLWSILGPESGLDYLKLVL